MPNVPAYVVAQNQLALTAGNTAPNQDISRPMLGTVGCAMCVGVALWKQANGTALLAHIQPDDLVKVQSAVGKIKSLFQDADKAHCVTAGNGPETRAIVDELNKAYPALEVHHGRDEIAIDPTCGKIRLGNAIIGQHLPLGDMGAHTEDLS
ncbi:MAG TPA: hypothetical protein VFV43_14405 [Limnobacter sp.]|nr:hypothetical protein [Limnobacter sp.]